MRGGGGVDLMPSRPRSRVPRVAGIEASSAGLQEVLTVTEGWNAPSQLVFPSWFDAMVKRLIAVALLGGGYVTALVAYGASPKTTDVGYAPEQPIPYSHKLHVGELGIDCRYCHNTVEESAHASIPPTTTCLNCHAKVLTQSPKLEPLRQSAKTGLPVEWVRIHDLPDYAYFNHSAHVTRGVGCVSCHGRIDTMEVVYQHEPLSMSWCVDCHRNPEANLRPPSEATNMTWEPPVGEDGEPQSRYEFGRQFKIENNINPPRDCSTCHR